MDEPYREGSNVAATLGPNKKHCHACANILDVRAELCPRCGVRQPVIAGMQQPGVYPPGAYPPGNALYAPGPYALVRTTKDKTTAGILALLLGGLGIHKFYLGQTGVGIVYLVFCWTFIPSLIAFVEGILYLTMSEQAFAQRYPG
jgi:TM2 domain-containing membrane protein YozV